MAAARLVDLLDAAAMKIGPLRDRVRIEMPAIGRDSLGAPVRAWAEVWEAAAQIDTYNGREWFTGDRMEAADMVRIRLRYHPRAVNVTAQCRAIDTRRGIVYAISQVRFDDKRTLLTLECVSGTSDG